MAAMVPRLPFCRPPDLAEGRFTDNELLQAVALWLTGRPANEIGHLLHCPSNLIRNWTNKEGWKYLARQAAEDVRSQTLSRTHRIAHAVFDRIEEAIERGDPIIGEDHTVIGYSPVRAKDLSQIASQMMTAAKDLGARIDSLGDEEQRISLKKLARALEKIADENQTSRAQVIDLRPEPVGHPAGNGADEPRPAA